MLNVSWYKRVVLTGHPIKIHKRVVTIRYMFFNREDINYFKAVSLFTKTWDESDLLKKVLVLMVISKPISMVN